MGVERDLAGLRERFLVRLDVVGSVTVVARELGVNRHTAFGWARNAERTPEWRRRFGQRDGIEATVSQGVRAFGPRQSRYRGHGKTHLRHLFTAAAMDLTRLDAWTLGTPRVGTRISRFEALRPAA